MQTAAEKNPGSGLHISYSQIFTYLSCSLRYQFKYVLGYPPEQVSLALPFGKALHKSLERYYRAIAQGKQENLHILEDLFAETLNSQVSEKDELVVYDKAMPDADSAINMGKSMLAAFYQSIDLNGWQIIGVEFPLSANLYTDKGETTDFKIVGVVDLLLKSPDNELVVVDQKTAAKAKSQADVDTDLQMTTYSYLLAANRYVFPTASVKCRFDVLRKLKTPKLEHCYTTRSAEDRRRLARIATSVLQGIDAGVYIPNRSWMCKNCEHAKACKDWHLN